MFVNAISVNAQFKMIDFLNPLFIVLGLCGLTFIIVGLILLFKPPKKINLFYGYRTHQSMSSQEKWEFAQRFSAREMIKQGGYMTLIGTLFLFINLNEMASMMIAIIIIILSVVLILFKTEKHLKQKFNKNETLQRDSEI